MNNRPRLNERRLDNLPLAVGRPNYRRDALVPGIVHFGPGAFHRAHQAAYADAVLPNDPRWSIAAVAINSTGVRDALRPQDGLYTLVTLDGRTRFRVIGSMVELLTADDVDQVVARVAASTTRIISTTVTEKGYCLGQDGQLDLDHPAVRADLTGDATRSLPGWLVRGLAERRRTGGGAVTLLSCDNSPNNGRLLRAAVMGYAHKADPDTASWIADHVRFPSTMVDAITPATDETLRARVLTATGMIDAWPVQREPFSEWVIEDDFAGERPPFDAAGALFAVDIEGFQSAKLRLLNGAHSTIAYLGLLLGHATVAEAMAEAAVSDFIGHFMRDTIAPIVKPVAGLTLASYIETILARFANPGIRHLLAQIAWDGSQKLPYRLLDTVRARRRAGLATDQLAIPIAAWFRFIDHAARCGVALVDPLADQLIARAGDPTALLALTQVFGDLSGDTSFRTSVIRAYARLTDAQAIRETLSGAVAG